MENAQSTTKLEDLVHILELILGIAKTGYHENDF